MKKVAAQVNLGTVDDSESLSVLLRIQDSLGINAPPVFYLSIIGNFYYREMTGVQLLMVYKKYQSTARAVTRTALFDCRHKNFL